MRNNELNETWIDLEKHIEPRKRLMQRMICVDLLYRAYIGATGMPSKRFLSIEIPQSEVNIFDACSVSKGFTLTISTPMVKHNGYVDCILQATSSEQNDVFTVLATDILIELHNQKEPNQYVKALKKRIDKWRDFFKSINTYKLSNTAIIGLFGELVLIKDLYEAGITDAVDFWNGPIRSAQDFQRDSIAIEVKTSVANSIDIINISNEAQLDDSQYNTLYLVVYRIEHNDATGITLPLLIKQVESILPESKRTYFWAKLTCLGYTRENEYLYKTGYSIKDSKVYRVCTGFPRLVKADLPQGVCNTKYKVSLQFCGDYKSDMDTIVKSLKEYEYGESRGTNKVL